MCLLKTWKIFLSKSDGPVCKQFCANNLWVKHYEDCSNYSDLLKTWPSESRDCFPYKLICFSKKKKRLLRYKARHRLHRRHKTLTLPHNSKTLTYILMNLIHIFLETIRKSIPNHITLIIIQLCPFLDLEIHAKS